MYTETLIYIGVKQRMAKLKKNVFLILIIHKFLKNLVNMLGSLLKRTICLINRENFMFIIKKIEDTLIQSLNILGDFHRV